MTEHDAALAAILAAPDDDFPRLRYADWLEEHGDPRGEFIRVQCEIARLDAVVEKWVKTPGNRLGGTREDGGPAGAALAEADILRRREWDLLERHSRRWFRVAGFEAWHRPGWGENVTGHDLVFHRDGHPEANWHGTVRRGFVSEVLLSAELWLAHADALLAAAPLEEVTLTTRLDAHQDAVAVWLEGRQRLSKDRSPFGAGVYLPPLLLGVYWPRIKFNLSPEGASPPVTITFNDRGQPVVIDGHHRVRAARRMGGLRRG